MQKGIAMIDEGKAGTGPTYFDNNEAAEFLKLSPRTLEKQRVRGDGPSYHKFGRRVVYELTDLQAWAAQRRYNSTTHFDVANGR